MCLSAKRDDIIFGQFFDDFFGQFFDDFFGQFLDIFFGKLPLLVQFFWTNFWKIVESLGFGHFGPIPKTQWALY